MTTKQESHRIVSPIHDLKQFDDLSNFLVKTADWSYSGLSLVFSERIEMKTSEPKQAIQCMINRRSGSPLV